MFSEDYRNAVTDVIIDLVSRLIMQDEELRYYSGLFLDKAAEKAEDKAAEKAKEGETE
ncbi:hypothetical protein [Huintestinicola butyrica]|uniref:hypothetical protein n=1 Tax=Huintestinicola butyrica TaxID=2981728 RepID=UPI003F81DA01